MGDHRAGKQTRPLARAIRGAEKMALGRTAAGRIAIMAVEPPKFKVSREISREDIFFSLARVAGSERVFLGSSNGSVYALDCAGKLDPVAMPGHTSYVTGLALAGEQLVSGSYDGQLIWWNAATRETTRKIKGHDRWIRDVKSSPDGKLLAAGGIDRVGNVDGLSAKARVDIFEWQDKKHIASLKMEKNGLIEFLAFHPKGDWLLAAGGEGKGLLAFIDPAGKKIIVENEAPMHIHKIALDEDCRRLFAAGHKKFALFVSSSDPQTAG